MRPAWVLLAALTLVACESTLDVQKTWIGNTDADLLAARGAPDLMASDSKGGKVLTYVNRWNGRECRENFRVGPRSTITYVSNDCPR